MRESEATSRKVRTSSRKSRECFAAESMYRLPRVRFSEVDWREGGERVSPRVWIQATPPESTRQQLEEREM